MKRLFVLSLLVSLASQGIAQDLHITFQAKGEVLTIDSIIALNQRTNQSITFPGSATLQLRKGLGLTDSRLLTCGLKVFPNPFSDDCTLRVTVDYPQNVQLTIRNLIGQVVAQTSRFLREGVNDFVCEIQVEGIYFINIKTGETSSGYPVVCISPSGRANRLDYKGLSYDAPDNSQFLALKSNNSAYAIDYSDGDILNYTCFSGTLTTIVTDTIPESKEIEVLFSKCTDPDGQHYKTVTIGTQTWMAENLAYLPSVSPSLSGSDTSPFYYVYGYEGKSISEAKQSANFATFGVLYNWVASKNACPAGWHLPTDDEWTTLTDYLTNNGYGFGGSGSDIGKSMASTSGWTTNLTEGRIGNDQRSNNRSGFTALPSGYRNDQLGFVTLGNGTAFYALEGGNSHAHGRSLNYDRDGVGDLNNFSKYGFSVRCLMNVSGESTPPTAFFTIQPDSGSVATEFLFDASGSSDIETPTSMIQVRWDFEGDGTWDSGYTTTKTAGHLYPEAGTYTILLEVKDAGGLKDTEIRELSVSAGGTEVDGFFDYEGRRYNYKIFGTQTWMIENLAYLPSVSPSSSGSETSPFYYVYGHEGSVVSAANQTANYATYGVLYNWEAAKTACPTGWHLPTDDEWTTLTEYLTSNGYGYGGSGDDIGKSMASTYGWNSYSTTGTIGNSQGSNNRSGFTALPGGSRGSFGGFYNIDFFANFWSSSENESSNAWRRNLGYNNDKVDRYNVTKRCGFSVRCVQNSSGVNTHPAASLTIKPGS